MRLVSFDYFRAIAIVLIVAGHSYGNWGIDTLSERVFANLITGGTVMFVFISGFFFHYAFYENFVFKRFATKKAKQILVPYLILSVAGIIYYLCATGRLPYQRYMGIEKLNSLMSYIDMVIAYLWSGGIFVPYWYIPFILVIFALSPLFIAYIRLAALPRIILFIAFLATSMLIHRPVGNLSTMHSVLYFLPIYMLGINYSLARRSIDERLRGQSIVIGIIVLILSIIQALTVEGYGNFHKAEIFSYAGVDIIIMQKIAMCFFFISILLKCQNHKIPLLSALATTSFAIFFIHPWVLMFFAKYRLMSLFGSLPEVVVFVITTILVLSASVLVAYIFKLVLRKNSRFVIGW